MAVPKRQAKYLGLRNLDVLSISQEVAADYFNVYECPEILTQGKSSFLIGGSSNLKPNVDLKIELVHQESEEVIYTQPVMGHSEGGLRRVSIEVYDDTTPGLYTLYIVGELNPDSVNVPQEWQGIYNVRWKKSITVNSMGVNSQPILFYKQPSINVSELSGNYVEIPSGSVTNIYLTGSGEPRSGITPIAPLENMTEGGAGIASYPEKDFQDKAKLSIIEENKPLIKLSGRQGLIGAKGKQVQTMSPVLDDYLISVSGNSTVDSLYVGQNFTINSPSVDTSKFTLESHHTVPSVYSSSIMKVINNKTFVPKDVFYINDTRTNPATLVPAPFASTYPISASYLPLPTQATSSINVLSFADIQVRDLKTFSGDVHKLKIYAKSEGSLGDFELIYDAALESFQVLFDKTEDTDQTNMGYFLDTTRVQKYWEAYQGSDGNTSGTLTYDANYVNDSMKISGSNKEYGDSLRVQNKTAVDFIAGTLYNFRAKVYGIKKDKKAIDGTTSPNASFKVMGYGDAFNKQETTGAQWGDEKLSIPDMPDAVSEYDFGIVEGSFLADNTATGYLQFKIDSGEWYVSDIELKAATDTAFNPDYVNLKAPVPPLLQRPDRVRFLVEFYDINDNIADSVIFSEPFTFTGPNINIGGTDNILSGSMYIGNALAAGIEMAGVSSAYVRSMGYYGFSSGSGGGNNAGDGTHSGFLMWSGSVLSDSGDDYKGVGLELVGNSGSYLKFRTDPSELDIRADSFFVGNENAQYVSGSGGQIEISSSNFHLSASGDVNMTGTITATAGEIGDWKIVDGKLSGSNATLDAVGAALHHTTKGPGSDSPPGGFHQLRDEYYIDFTPSQGATATAGKYYIKMGPNFSVSESGVLFASGAVFEGQITASTGFIGGASIESASLAYEPYWRISSSADTSDPVSFISSSNFKVSADGDVTGSDVRFTGGRIANWIIDGHLLKSLGVGGVRLNGNEGGAEISVGTHTFGNGPGIQLHYNSGNPQFFAGTSGNYIKYTVADGVDIQTTKFVLDSDNFDVTADGQITGSQVLFTGGKIAGWDITTSRITSPDGDMRFTSSNPKITIGTHTIGNGPGIQLGYDSGNTLTFFAGQSATDYIKYTAGVGVDIKTGKLELDASNVEISSTNASMSLGEGKLVLQGSSTPFMAVNSGSANQILIKTDGTDAFMTMGSKTSFSHQGSGTAGILIGMDAGNAQAEFVKSDTDYFIFDDGIDIKTGKLELDATNIEISSTNASMSIGEGNIKLLGASNTILVGATTSKQVSIVGSAGQGYIATGKTSATDTTAGFWLANNNTDPEFHVGNTTDFIKFDGGDLDIQSQKLEISSSTIQISSTNASMSLGHSTTYPRGRIILEGAGTPTFTAGTDASWISMSTGSGVYIDGDGNFRFGDDDGNVSFNNGSFAITGSDVDINVTEINITATGFQLSSPQASMSLGTNQQWKVAANSASPYMSIGMGGSGSYGDSGLWLSYNNSLGKPRVSFVGSTGHFKFTGTDLDIKTGTLALAASNLQLSSTQASMSLGGVPGAAANILLDGANSRIEVGSSNKVTIQGSGTDNYIVMGSKSTFTHYDKSTVGIILGMDSSVPKFEMAKSGDEYLRWDSTDGLDIRTKKLEVSASNIEISSTHASMSVGDPNSSGGAIVLHSDGTDKMLKFGGKTTFDQTTTAGLIMGMDGTAPEFDYTVGTSNDQYLRLLPAGIDIKTPSFKLDTDRLDIDSATSRIDVYDASDGLRVRIGEVDPTAGSHYGMVIYDGTGTAGTDELVHFSDVKNQIASWSLSNTQISSQNLILDSSGTIQTADFASGVQGWRITSANNGEAEFEKVTVRGTLSTTVFEKESVNAVGGQLYVANSTIYTGSSAITATTTTMSVANVGGFSTGEILSAKKITATGFATEYMKVESASRDYPSSDTDLRGKLYLIRGYGVGITGESGSLGGTPGISQSYDNGQVIVSTGKSGSGFIRLNANPNDTTTPYMDIVERTGSGVYDISLKARLGDLSGLSSGLLYGETNPGFGLFTENVFLQGGITAVTGSITGKLHVRTDALNQVIIGTNVKGTQDGIYINNNNYWFTDAEWRVGDTNNFIFLSGSGGSLGNDLSIQLEKFELNAGSGDLKISSTEKSMSFGDGDIIFQSPTSTTSWGRIGSTTTKAIYITGSNELGAIRSGKTHVGDTTEGFWIANNDQDAEFVVGDGTDFIKFDDNELEVKTRKLELAANTDDLQISSTHKSMSLASGNVLLDGSATAGYIRIGSATARYNNINISGSSTIAVIKAGFTGSYADGVTAGDNGFILERALTTTKFHVGSGTEYIRFDGTNIDISAANFNVTASNVNITAGDGMEVDAPHFEVSTANVSMSLGYDTNANYGINLVGAASANYINFGNKSTPPLKLYSGVGEGSSGVDSYLSINNKNFGDTTTTGIILGSDAGVYKLEMYKDEDEYFKFTTGADGLDVRTTKLRLKTAGLTISGSDTTAGNNKIMLGSATSVDAGEGFFVDGGGNFRIGDATSGGTNFMKFTSSGTLQIKSEDIDITSTAFSLAANTDDLQLSSAHKSMSLAGGKIKLEGSSTHGSVKIGTVADVTDTSGGNAGFFGSGNGNLILKSGANKYVQFLSGSLNVKTQNLELDASNIELSSTNASMSLGEGKIKMVGDSTSYITVGTANAITLKDDGTDRYLVVGDKTSFSHFNQSTDGIILGTDNGTAKFEVAADADNYLSFNGSGLDIKAETFDLKTTNLRVSSSAGGTIAMGSTVPTSISGSGVFLSGSGEFLVGSHSGNKIQFSPGGSKILMQSNTFALNATTIIIDSSANSGKIALGASPPSAYNNGTGVYMDGTGKFLAGIHNGNRISFDGTDINLVSDTFTLDATTVYLDSTTPSLRFAADASALSYDGTGIYIGKDGSYYKMSLKSASGDSLTWDGNGTLTITGNITADSGNIGGFTIDGHSLTTSGVEINDSTQTLFINTSNFDVSHAGNVTASNVDLSGKITATSGEIGGWDVQSGYIQKDGTRLNAGSQNGYLGIGVTSYDSNDGIWLGEVSSGVYKFSIKNQDGSKYLRYTDSAFEIAAGNFSLDSSGDITATSVDLTGDITANTGYLGGSSNGWTIATSKISSTYNSEIIGLVQQNAAHADVGSVSAFYAGASADTGEDATISFGSDGKIRGSGVYVRSSGGESKEFSIGAETVFGQGQDGDIFVRIHAGNNTLQAWTSGSGNPEHSFDGDTSVSSQYITSQTFGDNIMQFYHTSGQYLKLTRDVYCRKFIADISDGTLYIYTNGYRLFCSDGLFVYSDSGGSGNKIHIFYVGGEGNDGVTGGNGASKRQGGSYSTALGGTGGAAGAGKSAIAGGTLKGMPATPAGGKGGDGGRGISTGGESGDTGTAGTAGSNSDATSTSNDGRAGRTGGTGGQSSTAQAGAGAAGGAGGASADQAGIQISATPADSVVKMRTEFGSNDYPERLMAGVAAGGAGGGGGGGGDSNQDGTQYETFGGGGGGGGASAGQPGGTILLSARVIDYWKSTSPGYGTTQVHASSGVNSLNNSGNYGSIYIYANGSDGGKGGTGGEGGSLTAS